MAGSTGLSGSPTCPMVRFKGTGTTLLWGANTCPAGHRPEPSGMGWCWDGAAYAEARIVLC